MIRGRSCEIQHLAVVKKKNTKQTKEHWRGLLREPWDGRKTSADGERAAEWRMREQGKNGLMGHCFVLSQCELVLSKGIGYPCFPVSTWHYLKLNCEN